MTLSIKAPFIAASFVLLALAGCIGGDDTIDPTGTDGPGGPGSFSEDTGAVEGVVTDDESLPVGGAQAAILGHKDKAATTDDGGRFALSNIPPGTHTLFVQALGYQAVAKSIQVNAGQTTTVEVALPILPTDDPYIESFNHNGQYGVGAAIVRTTLCYGCSDAEHAWFFIPGGFPDDFAGMLVEAQWETSDFFGFDLNTRGDQCDPSCMWYRTRGESPLRYEVFPCQDYTGEPYFGRVPMPCGPEEFANFQDDSGGDAVRLETWYMGQFQEEAHTLDEVCRTPIDIPVQPIPGYEAGCYGLGLAPETRWTTWVTIYHKEVPEDHESITAFPDA